MRLTSAAFDEGGMLPPRFTCDDAGASPPLAWEDVHDGTQGFAHLRRPGRAERDVHLLGAVQLVLRQPRIR